jgi:hypothetical protein
MDKGLSYDLFGNVCSPDMIFTCRRRNKLTSEQTKWDEIVRRTFWFLPVSFVEQAGEDDEGHDGLDED